MSYPGIEIVDIGGVSIAFGAGERILTECSYKYSVASFGGLARVAGFEVTHVWTDPQRLFSVHFLASDAARDIHGAIVPVYGRS